MSSRDQILQRLKANRPQPAPLPENITFSAPPVADRLALFIKSFTGAGGVVKQVPDLAAIAAVLQQEFPDP